MPRGAGEQQHRGEGACRRFGARVVVLRRAVLRKACAFCIGRWRCSRGVVALMHLWDAFDRPPLRVSAESVAKDAQIASGLRGRAPPTLAEPPGAPSAATLLPSMR